MYCDDKSVPIMITLHCSHSFCSHCLRSYIDVQRTTYAQEVNLNHLGEILESHSVFSQLDPSQLWHNLHLQSIAINEQLPSILSTVIATSTNRGPIVCCGTPLAYLAQEVYVHLIIGINPINPKGNHCSMFPTSIYVIFLQASFNVMDSASLGLQPVQYFLHSNFLDGVAIWCIGFRTLQELVTNSGDLVGAHLIVVTVHSKKWDPGKMIMRNVAETVILVTLELGGKNAFIVCEDVGVDHDALVQQVTLVPIGQARGFTWSISGYDLSLISQSPLFAIMVGGLGSRAAEAVILGETEKTIGATRGLQQITPIEEFVGHTRDVITLSWYLNASPYPLTCSKDSRCTTCSTIYIGIQVLEIATFHVRKGPYISNSGIPGDILLFNGKVYMN